MVIRGALNRVRSSWRSRPEGLTSISDNGEYPALCAQAAREGSIFATFRRNPTYTEVLEHVTREMGQQYLEIIVQRGLLEIAREVVLSDDVGDPVRFEYDGLGLASPTTLRYLKVYSDLQELFGDLSGMDIVEIGVGYGGQCRIIQSLDRPASYTLVDLPEVLELSSRYLQTAGIASNVRAIPNTAVGTLPNDLLISNYAFSELRRQVQEQYEADYLLTAKRGYLTYNSISPRSFRGMTASEVSAAVGGSIADEVPLTFAGNCVVTWGIQPSV